MPIFDIQTHLDFYNMLVEDFDEFMREQHSARHAFHCILDAYHLREWLWHDLIENNQNIKAALKIKSESDFNAFINQSFPWFSCLKDITNGSKHFEQGEQRFEAYKVAAAPFSFDVLGAGFNEGAWDGPVRYVSGQLPVGQDNKGVLMFDFGEEAKEHRYLPVLHVVEAAVRFWRDFLRTLHPNISIKSSAHHNL